MILFDGETDCYQPRPAPFFQPRRIVLAKGSRTTAERCALVEKVCDVYPGAQVVDDPATPHNKIDLGPRALVDRHNLGKRTLVLGELGQAVGESKERWSACPNYRHFSLYGFCPYRCDYCYLAGTRGVCFSPTVKIFVNLAEILGKIERAAAGLDRPTAFYHGKLQDGLALDPLTGYSRRLVPLFARHPYARLTLLTKSADVENLLDLDHRGRSILSWSVNPPEIAQAFEKNVPPVADRIEAMCRASEAGYPVRAVVMPILPLDDWRESYARFLERLVSRVSLDRITLGSICSYTTAVRLMEWKLNRGNPISCLLEPPRRACGDGRARFPQATRLEAYRLLIDTVRRVRPELEIGLCLEDPTTFERLKIVENVGRCNCVL